MRLSGNGLSPLFRRYQRAGLCFPLLFSRGARFARPRIPFFLLSMVMRLSSLFPPPIAWKFLPSEAPPCRKKSPFSCLDGPLFRFNGKNGEFPPPLPQDSPSFFQCSFLLLQCHEALVRFFSSPIIWDRKSGYQTGFTL